MHRPHSTTATIIIIMKTNIVVIIIIIIIIATTTTAIIIIITTTTIIMANTTYGEGAWPNGLWRCKASVSQWSERPWVRVPEWRWIFIYRVNLCSDS